MFNEIFTSRMNIIHESGIYEHGFQILRRVEKQASRKFVQKIRKELQLSENIDIGPLSISILNGIFYFLLLVLVIVLVASIVCTLISRTINRNVKRTKIYRLIRVPKM